MTIFEDARLGPFPITREWFREAERSIKEILDKEIELVEEYFKAHPNETQVFSALTQRNEGLKIIYTVRVGPSVPVPPSRRVWLWKRDGNFDVIAREGT